MVNGDDTTANGQLSQAAIGRAMNLSPAAMTKLKKQGMPVHSVEAALAWRTARQNIAQRKPIPAPVLELVQPTAPPRHEPAPKTNDETHDQARTRREIAEANLAELKLRELRGELVRVDKVRAERQRRVAAMREVMLQLPARLVPVLAADSSPAAMDLVLKREIAAAMHQVVEGN